MRSLLNLYIYMYIDICICIYIVIFHTIITVAISSMSTYERYLSNIVISTMWGPQDSVQLVNITTISRLGLW